MRHIRHIVTLSLLLFAACQQPRVLFAQTGALLPALPPSFLNASGEVAANGQLCTTATGTTTPLTTYSNAALTSALPNPITLNGLGIPQTSGGQSTAIYIQAQQYRITLYAAGTGNTCNGQDVGAVIWTRDGVYDFGQLFAEQSTFTTPALILPDNASCPSPASGKGIICTNNSGQTQLSQNGMAYATIGGGGGSAGWSYTSPTVTLTTPTDRVIVGASSAGDFSASPTFDSSVIATNFLYATNGTVTNASVLGLGYDSGTNTMQIVSGSTGAGVNLPLEVKSATDIDFYANSVEEARIRPGSGLQLLVHPLAVSSGGTGNASAWTGNGILFASSTATTGTSSAFTWNNLSKQLDVTGASGTFAAIFNGAGGAGTNFGVEVNGGTNSSDYSFFANANSIQTFGVRGDNAVVMGSSVLERFIFLGGSSGPAVEIDTNHTNAGLLVANNLNSAGNNFGIDVSGGMNSGDFGLRVTPENSATAAFTVRGDSAIIMSSLTTTGSATGKKVVCVDTSTGILYASSASNSCAN